MTDECSHLDRIAVTMGDPNGIGPELVLRCLSSAPPEWGQPIVVGSVPVLRAHARKLGFGDMPVHSFTELPARLSRDALNVLEVAPGSEPRVRFGEITQEGGQLAMQAVEAATDLCLQHEAAAMVTAPISKEAITRAGYHYPGHTEFIAERTGAGAHTMMMITGAGDGTPPLRVGLVTGHVAVADVARGVTPEAILEKLHVINGSLDRDFGEGGSRIAVLGLNPHAGDGGVMGTEEEEVIGPAVERARAEGIPADGPYPADGFFGLRRYRDFGAVLAMYHDQGLVPFKALAFDRGVNFTAGLPIVRTSPDHGTAYDIAGKGQADLGSMQQAMTLAHSIAERRIQQRSS